MDIRHQLSVSMPAVRWLAALILGIGMEVVLTMYFPIPPSVTYGLLAVVLVGICVCVYYEEWMNVRMQFRYHRGMGVMHYSLIAALGFLLSWFNTEINYNSHFGYHLREQNVLRLYVNEPPTQKGQITFVTCKVLVVQNENGQTPTTGKLLLNLFRNDSSELPHYGDVLLVSTTPQPFDPPKNPEEFNFKQYQAFHNIYHRAFVQTSRVKMMERQTGYLFFEVVYGLRDELVAQLRAVVKSERDCAVAESLVIGYRDDMTQEIMKAYSSSGALHVLSVSGLHVGALVWVLNFLLGFMDKRNGLRITKMVLLLVIVWFYACITGLSPSVLRSAAMITFLLVGTGMRLRSNIYNTLACSAFVLLLFDPFLITEVGFKLSYFAVLGIIGLQRTIYGWWHVKNWLGDKAWQVTAVSISAQIATSPLGVYYFHQFPVYFLISNLVVIPISTVALIVSMLLFLVKPIPMLFEAVGWILNLSVHWLNEFVFLIDRMPMALINGLTIATVELVAWYIIIVLIILLLRQMRALYFISFLSCVLVVSCFYTYRNITQLHNTEMTVYSTKKLHGLAFIRGKEVCYDFDDALRSNWSTMMFHVQHHWWARGVEHEHNLRESSSDIVPSVQTSVGRLYAFAGKKILLCEQAPPYRKQPLREKLEADVLVLSHNPKMSLKNLLKLVTVKQVVTDGSNKKYKVAKWREECRLAKVPFHDVSEQGAFRVEL